MSRAEIETSQSSRLPPRSSPSDRRPAKRILWAARSYWPLGAGRHNRAAASVAMTTRLSEAGYDIDVLTPKYSTRWSESFQFGSIRVHRIATVPKGEWSVQRYVRYVSQWIMERADRYDVIVCDGLHDDVRAVAAAITKLRVSGSSLDANGSPIGIAICDGWGGDADEVACRQSRGGRRNLAAAAELNFVITRHAGADRCLVAHGVSPDRLRRIPTGFARPTRLPTDQLAASRRALAAANSDLTTAADDRVLLWCGDMHADPLDNTGVATIVANARLLCGRYPKLRIWLLGDGHQHDWVHTELKADGVRDVVAIPGTFSDMTDVWRSVDFVVVNDEDQLRYVLPSAIERAIPVLLDDKPTIRAWVNEHFSPQVAESFAWYDHHKAASLRKAFRMIWDDMPGTIQHAWQIAQDASHRLSDFDESRHWSSIFNSVSTDQERRA